MTTLSIASRSAQTAVDVVARVLRRIGSAVAWSARVTAEARLHRAMLEAERHRNRCRLNTKNDDDLPVII